MRRNASSHIVTLLLFAITLSPTYAQTLPSDLIIRASAGGVEPWEEVSALQVNADGEAFYTRYLPADLQTPPSVQESFTLSSNSLQKIWDAIEFADFFNLDSLNIDPSAGARSFVRLRVRANGTQHLVEVRGVQVVYFDLIIDAINRETPGDLDLDYDSQPPPFVYMADPCTLLPPTSVLGKEEFNAVQRLKSEAWRLQKTASASSVSVFCNPFDNLNTPGTMVHTDLPLSQAVPAGKATLKAKGNFFGDGVSMEVDNTDPGPPPSQVDITLHMEFYGSGATDDNISRIKNSIEEHWSDDHVLTDDGQFVDIETHVESRTRDAVSPGRPGYHQIHLVDHPMRSYVTGLPVCFDVNRGTASGEWATVPKEGEDLDQTFAHETGHLLGLDDRYVDYKKASITDEATWISEDDLTPLSNEEMAQRYSDANEAWSYEQALDYFKNAPWLDDISVPKESRYKDDLMASLDGKVNPNDLANLAKKAGLLVYADPGQTLVGNDDDAQNFVTTRPESVFAPPGERRRVNGIFIACIDATKHIPMPEAPFDVGLPLKDWRGVPKVEQLQQFLEVTSSQDEYCLDGVAAGVWRFTNNVGINDQALQDFMDARGTDLGDEYLDFPHLSNPSDEDSTTSLVLPPELFVTTLTPTTTLVYPNDEVSVGWSMVGPSGVNVESSSFSWMLEKPDGSNAEISNPQDSLARFMPDLRGLYRPTLGVDVATMEYPATHFERQATIVVADDQTDTFERDSLRSTRFPWQTYGGQPWTLTDQLVHSGGLSARSGPISNNDSTVLEIGMLFPEPGELSFSYNLISSKGWDYLHFSIDGIGRGSWTGVVEWADTTLSVSAGKHNFRWSYTKSLFGVYSLDAAWIDDVFFPPNAVSTAIEEDADRPSIPTEYALSQNYPNPFNPTTTISFALPESKVVALTVYDELGKEVAVLVDGPQSAGRHQVVFDARQLPSGTYYYRLTAGTFSKVRAMVVTK